MNSKCPAAGLLPAALSLAEIAFVAGVSLLAACSPADSSTRVRVASTTSLYDTGLIEELVPAFEAAHPEYDVQVVAVGTGEALALGERRDAALLIVHAPQREEAFVAAGHGLRRTTFMRNDFVLAGPEADPAGVAAASGAADAMRRIAGAGREGRAEFASRGDDSGTHIRERVLWDEAGIEPGGAWYLEVGQGMGATVQFAGERQAYLLTDAATLAALGASGVGLAELHRGGPSLENVYSVIPVSGEPASGEPHAGALAFERWILGDEAAALIERFGAEEYGRPLFTLTTR